MFGGGGVIVIVASGPVWPTVGWLILKLNDSNPSPASGEKAVKPTN